MEWLATGLRWLQLTSGLVLLAPAGHNPAAARWRRVVLAAAPWLLALSLAAAAGLLMLQAASVSGRGEAAFDTTLQSMN